MEFGCFKNPCKIEMKKNIYKYNFNRKIQKNIFSIKQPQLKFKQSFYNKLHTDVIPTDCTFKCEYMESANYNPQLPLLLLRISR